MIEVKNLSKRYGGRTVVDRVSFTVEQGSITGFLGPNGVGKSTTFNMMTGFIAPYEGDVCYNGKSILTEPRAAKRNFGYLPEHPPLYPDMTVEEYLRFVCRLKEIVPKQVKGHVNELIGKTQLEAYRNRLIRNLSKGCKQRVGLAQALVGYPDTLILDEPTEGLDPRQIVEFRQMIRELGKAHTILLSSHILGEVADICRRIIIIDQGRIVAEDALNDLAKQQQCRLLVRVAGDYPQALQALGELEEVVQVNGLGQVEAGATDFEVVYREGADVRARVSAFCAGQGLALLSLKQEEVGLEEIFLRLTSRDRGEERDAEPLEA